MAVGVVMLLMCLAPHVFLYPMTQQWYSTRLQTIRPTLWSLPFCACFSYEYLSPCHGRRQRESIVQQELVSKGMVVGVMHRMQEGVVSAFVCVNRRIGTRVCAFNLSLGKHLCCHQGVPSMIHLVKVIISLFMLVPAPIVPCFAKGAGSVMRLNGQAGGYLERFQLGNKGTNALVYNRDYKPDELLSLPKYWISGEGHSSEGATVLKTVSTPEALKGHDKKGEGVLEKGNAMCGLEDEGRKISEALKSATGENEGGINLPGEDQPSFHLEHSYFSKLKRNSFQVKCSPLLASSLDLKQQLEDEQQQVHFANDHTVSLQLFKDLMQKAVDTGTHVLSPSGRDDNLYCHKSSPGHLTAAAMHQSSILLSSELFFPLVQIGKEGVHWLNIMNPSKDPLHVQALVSSKAEPTGWTWEAVEGQTSKTSELCYTLQGDNMIVTAHDDISSYPRKVFSFADGAVVEALIEPYGNFTLGPVVFQPPERCLWTGLLSVWNNLTQVEWVPLLGSGGSWSLTFLDGDNQINQVQLEFNLSQVASITPGAIEDHAKVDLNSTEIKSALCSQCVSRKFLVKNTGDVHLHVTGVELYGGSCSAHGFVVNSCKEKFSLAPGQGMELSISYEPDLSTGIFQWDLQLMTSAGVVQLPVLAIQTDYSALHLLLGDSTMLYKALLWVSSIALLVVLAVFFQMLAKEMALLDKQSPTGDMKSNPLRRGGCQVAPLPLSSRPLTLPKRRSRPVAVVALGHVARSGIHGEQVVQSKAGLGNGLGGSSATLRTGASSAQKKLKNFSTKMGPVRVSRLSGGSDTCTTTFTSFGPPALAPAPGLVARHPSKCKAEVSSASPSISGLQVKIPNSAAWNVQKSVLGSPMQAASSTAAPGVELPKGTAGAFHGRNNVGTKIDGGLQTKIDNVTKFHMEGNLLLGSQTVKQSSLVKSAARNNSSSSYGLISTPTASDKETAQQRSPQMPAQSVNSKTRSAEKSSHFLETSKATPSPSPKHAQGQAYQPWATNEKDKSRRRKKRRSNVGTVEHEFESKAGNGTSSPLPSPATQTACLLRPLSPLSQSLNVQLQQQPNTPGLSSSACAQGCLSSSPKDYSKCHTVLNAKITPLSKLDVEEDFSSQVAHGAVADEKMKLPISTTSLPMYRGEGLSVDDAMPDPQEMAKAKSLDQSWAKSRAKENQSSMENINGIGRVGRQEGALRDWISVVHKAGDSSDPLTTGRKGEKLEDRSWLGSRVDNNFRKRMGNPALTPSATFPQRLQYEVGLESSSGVVESSELRGVKPMGVFHREFPVSRMPPASRAPGTKLAPKSIVEEPRGDDNVHCTLWSIEGAEKYRSSIIWGNFATTKKGDDSISQQSNFREKEDKGVYGIWGNHYGEFSHCATSIVGSVIGRGGLERGVPGGAAGQSLAVLNAAPSFFSSFP